VRTVYLVATTQDFKRIAVVKGRRGWQLPRWDGSKRIPPGRDEPLPLTAHINPTDIVHWSRLPPRDFADTDGDMYCLAVLGKRVGGLADERLDEFVLLDREHALTQNLLSGREQLAVVLSLSRAEAPVAAFDSHEEVRATIAWAEHQIAEAACSPITAIARYRHDRHDLIVRIQTGPDAMYLKSGKERFTDEARLTQLLHALLPDYVPETIAAEPSTHRWLYREMPGVMMSTVPVDHHTTVAAVRALVSIQQATLDSEHIARHVAARRQTAIDLYRAVDSYVEHAWHSVHPSDALASVADTWTSLRDAMLRACAAVDQLDVPLALVPSDYWSQNILITPRGIGIIDLGNSFWSHPVLPLWRLVRDTKRRISRNGDVSAAGVSIRAAIGSAFIDAWSSLVPARVMTRAIEQLWLIGRLFGIQIAALDLDLAEQSLGMDLPPAYRAARLADRIRDLSRAFALQVIVPRRTEPELAEALNL
jgi:hypothetical protein